MKSSLPIFFMIMIIIFVPYPVYSCDIVLSCDNVTYIMVGKTWKFSVPDNKWDTVYAIAVFLTKKKFDFAEIRSQCKNENINIYAQGVHIGEISVDEFTSGALSLLRDNEGQAFHTAQTICREKTDPDLRR